jgi:hypothetical protein
MLTAHSVGALASETFGAAVVPTRCIRTHSHDPIAIGQSKPLAIALSQSDRERILADFAKLYVGAAHGIDKAVLEATDADCQRIVVYVYDWNGILNIPENYQGMPVAFTQYVPIGGIW